MGGVCSTHGTDDKCITTLYGRREWKKPLGRSRHGKENDMKMNLKEVGSEGVEWIHLAQDVANWGVLMNVIMNLLLLGKARNFLTRLAYVSFLRKTVPRSYVFSTV
jgi:hypothetical protein